MISIVVLLSNVIITEFNNQTADYVSPAGNTLNQSIIDAGMTALDTFDYAILFIVMGLGLAVIVLGFFIRTHPILFVFSLILLMFFVLIASIFTNTFGEFITVEPIATTIDSYPLMYDVFMNLPLIITVIGIVTMIAMYAKRSGGDIGV
jgi:hypothetical protein